MCCLLQIDGAETLPSVPSTSAPSGTIPGIRVSTLTYHSVAFLQACGAWKSMAPPPLDRLRRHAGVELGRILPHPVGRLGTGSTKYGTRGGERGGPGSGVGGGP